MKGENRMLGERKLWKWCLPSANQCEQAQGNCDKCQYREIALKRKRKKEKIERFDEKKEEIENEKD